VKSAVPREAKLETGDELHDRIRRGATVFHILVPLILVQIFGMIVQGKTVTDIAAELSLSVKTVSTHKTRVLEKMNFTNQAELVRYALTHRLFDAPND